MIKAEDAGGRERMNLSEERGHRKPGGDASAVMGPTMRVEVRAVGTQEWRLGLGG